MVRALPALLVLLSTACGLAEDERDEENKYIYLTFYDKAFEAYCLGAFDVDGDGRISRYEAQRVRGMECPERGIASLSDGTRTILLTVLISCGAAVLFPVTPETPEAAGTEEVQA